MKKLKSRYEDTWELEEVDKGYIWKNIPDYTRYGFFADHQDDISFVDPPGGPFIQVGTDIFPGELVIGITETEDGLFIKTYKKEED